MNRSIWRVLLGMFAGASGGVGMAMTIFPFVIGKVFTDVSLDMFLGPNSYLMPIVLLWATGGGVVGWWGGVREGGVIMGLCGVIAGVTLSLASTAPTWNVPLIVLGALAGLAYGAIGGVIMGMIFPKPHPQSM